MNQQKIIDGIKRILNNQGSIEIKNNKNQKLVISDEIIELINYIEYLQKESVALSSKIETDRKSLIYYNRLKKFTNDFKARKEILESDSHFQMLINLYKGKKIDKFIFDGNLKENDINLIELFQLWDKLKL